MLLLSSFYEETKAQRGHVTCSESHSQTLEPGLGLWVTAMAAVSAPNHCVTTCSSLEPSPSSALVFSQGWKLSVLSTLGMSAERP